jgi:UDP-sulfoquinovose synthase
MVDSNKRLSDTIFVLGGDGYLGWSVALALAARTDSLIVIMDNLSKRKWEADVGVSSLFALKPPQERIDQYASLYGRDNLRYESVDLTVFEATHQVFSKYLPKVVVNAAQQPSAPFSMMSPYNARVTFDNNSTTNLNVSWSIAQINNDILHVVLGSAGSYLSIDSDFIPKAKVDLEFNYKNSPHKILNSWIPMQASDIYHQSKVNSFLLNDLTTNLWGLKTITVQQSTIFGHAILENRSEKHWDLSTRFNYDHIFGTVLNRFVCQAAIGHPITVYGNGRQTTGIIALSDAVDNLIKLCGVSLEKGTHKIAHNYSHTLSINDMVEELRKISNIEVQNIENPRLEKSSRSRKVFEAPEVFPDPLNRENFRPALSFDSHLRSLYEFASHFRENINPAYILPSVNWKMTK